MTITMTTPIEKKAPITEFRALVAAAEQQGVLRHCHKQVAARYELPALLKQGKAGAPICFHQVDQFSCPVVGGLSTSRAALAASMGISPDQLRPHFAHACANPLPVHLVTQAPVQQNVILAPFTITDHLPILTYYEKDSAPFLVSGILVLKNRDGSKTYTSVRRLQYLGENKCNITMTSRRMQQELAYHREHKTPMEIALMFGVVPAVFLGSQISTQWLDVNKLDVTGALLGESLAVVPCKTVNLEVLANAEFVLEGKIEPWITDTEGPFGEMCRYYGSQSLMPRVTFTALTHRDQPILQTLFPSGPEEILPMALFREVMLYQTVKRIIPGLEQVHLTPGGCGRLHAVLQLKQEKPGQARQAALTAFAADKDLKHVVVVDEDVDLFDAAQVEWAIATRMQADRDLFIIPDCDGSPLEPSHHLTGRTAKVAIDATKPLGDSRFDTTHIPGEEAITLAAYLDE